MDSGIQHCCVGSSAQIFSQSNAPGICLFDPDTVNSVNEYQLQGEYSPTVLSVMLCTISSLYPGGLEEVLIHVDPEALAVTPGLFSNGDRAALGLE